MKNIRSTTMEYVQQLYLLSWLKCTGSAVWGAFRMLLHKISAHASLPRRSLAAERKALKTWTSVFRRGKLDGNNLTRRCSLLTAEARAWRMHRLDVSVWCQAEEKNIGTADWFLTDFQRLSRVTSKNVGVYWLKDDDLVRSSQDNSASYFIEILQWIFSVATV